MTHLKNSNPQEETLQRRNQYFRGLLAIFQDVLNNKNDDQLLEQGYIHLKENLTYICNNTIASVTYRKYIEFLLPLLYQRGDWHDALISLEKATKKKQNSSDLLITLDWLSRFHQWLGRYSEAEKVAKKGLDQAKQFNDKLSIFEFFLRLGKVQRTLGNYREALRFYEEAENLEISGSSCRDNLTYLMVSKGLAHWHLNGFDQSLICYNKALSLCKETGNIGKEGQTLNNIGLVYAEVGLYREALGLHEQALAIASKIKDTREAALNKGNIGMVYLYLKEYQKAIDYLTDALQNAEQLKSKYRAAKAKAQLSLAYRLRNNEAEDLGIAARYAMEAYQIGCDTGIIHFKILGASYLGISYYNQGNTHSAVEFSSEAVCLLDRQSIFDGPEEEIYFNHFLILVKQNEGETHQVLKKSFECLQKKISQTSNPNFKNSLMQNVELNRSIIHAYSRLFDANQVNGPRALG